MTRSNEMPDSVWLSTDRRWAKKRTDICTVQYVKAKPSPVITITMNIDRPGAVQKIERIIDDMLRRRPMIHDDREGGA